jgi:hypothetical protein
MTCAACHTGEFTYGQHRVRIDGAPTLADFQSLMEGVLASLVATRTDTPKFDRFVTAVLGANTSAEDRAKVIADLDRQIAWFTRLESKNASPIRYGHGRLDAQDHIMNKIALSVGASEPLVDFPSDAPAGYPFLWTTPQHVDRVQWNGIAPQPIGVPVELNGKTFDTGAMLRNITELVGVFGSFDVGNVPSENGYASSLRIENMIDLENLVKILKSSHWPEQVLPPIDVNLANEGRGLYNKFKCNDCHTVLDKDPEPQATVTITMIPLKEVGTDIWLACNAYLHESKSGLLEGRDSLLFGPIGEMAPTFHLLLNISINMLLRAQQPPTPTAMSPVTSEPTVSANPNLRGGSSASESAMSANRNMREAVMNANRNMRVGASVAPIAPSARLGEVPEFDDPVKEQRAQRCRNDTDQTLAYKARPLNGIWATAPCLHNGSVPTLYELLLPPNQRKTVFSVGGTEFDPIDVGFKSGPGDGPSEFRVRDTYV